MSETTETTSKHLTEEEETVILKGLIRAMRDGQIESLTYKRLRKNGKDFECEIRSPLAACGMSATSTEGKHNLAYLFLDTVRSAIGRTLSKLG